MSFVLQTLAEPIELLIIDKPTKNKNSNLVLSIECFIERGRKKIISDLSNQLMKRMGKE